MSKPLLLSSVKKNWTHIVTVGRHVGSSLWVGYDNYDWNIGSIEPKTLDGQAVRQIADYYESRYGDPYSMVQLVGHGLQQGTQMYLGRPDNKKCLVSQYDWQFSEGVHGWRLENPYTTQEYGDDCIFTNEGSIECPAKIVSEVGKDIKIWLSPEPPPWDPNDYEYKDPCDSGSEGGGDLTPDEW